MTALSLAAVAAWIYLIGFRGAFWMSWRYHDLDQRGEAPKGEVSAWPAVVAIVPARDEALSVGRCVRSILDQDYPGELSVILIDDQSSDGTAQFASEAVADIGALSRLTVIAGEPLPAGWTGKLWAVRQGIAHAERRTNPAPLVLLTDADIVYADNVVRRLVSHAQAHSLAMTSVMARLRNVSVAERVLIPAFIYFFQMLYPFSWVRRADCATAAAAGGCVLVRSDALRQSGGIDAIRGALIDDCTLAAQLKRVGPIWLGFCEGVKSMRASDNFADVGRMICRSAYAQLRYSPLILAGTLIGLALVFLVPVLLTLAGHDLAAICGLVTWLALALSFYPTLHDYEASVFWGLLLPGIAVLYMGFTIMAAWQHARGRGGMWKGRAQAQMVRSS